MTRPFPATLPDLTTFRTITGYFYAYDADIHISDEQETAQLTASQSTDPTTPGLQIGIHVSDETKQHKTKRDQLRSQIRLLKDMLPTCDDQDYHSFDRYGFTDSDTLPDGALYIAQFCMDMVFTAARGPIIMRRIIFNEQLPEIVFASINKYLNTFGPYVNHMFDLLDSMEPDNETVSPSVALATFNTFESKEELDMALSDEQADPMFELRMAHKTDGTIAVTYDWHRYEDEKDDTFHMRIGYDFCRMYCNALPEEPVGSKTNPPSFASFATDEIPDKATPIALLICDNSGNPPMLRCFMRMPDDQVDEDTLTLLGNALHQYLDYVEEINAK
ncbi:hypothetical protein [Bifidobacterium sp. SO1]|uniref:hypothetical protein n=1 Tax=Bifidobacterium sp. SO1 TaxID=2809029 RepID=UPI001BDD382D|nr:hypothetical protein [Bifidobacterium sp. SO1]MBT1162177.1 hypothetical protein [Bifidobacterium sp. SO1]